MKKLVSIIALLAAVLFVACNKTETNPGNEGESGEGNGTVEVIDSVTRIATRQLYNDNKFNGQETYSYDEYGNLLEVHYTDAIGNTNVRLVPVRENGLTVRLEYLEGEDSIKALEFVYKYDSEGRLINSEWERSSGIAYYKEDYTWEGDKITQIIAYYSNYTDERPNNIDIYKYYHDAAGNVTKCEESSPNSEVVRICEFEYDDNKNIGNFMPIEQIPYYLRLQDMFWSKNNIVSVKTTLKSKTTDEIIKVEYADLMTYTADDNKMVTSTYYESLSSIKEEVYTYKTFPKK